MDSVKIDAYHYRSPVSWLLLEADSRYLQQVLFVDTLEPFPALPDNIILRDTVKQLDEYFAGTRRHFNLPLDLDNYTAFQKLVWTALTEIPFGETRTYKDIAISIGKDKGYRAVGNACGANDYPIIIPCHRVVSSTKGLGGFAAPIEIKKKLLEHERKFK